MRKLKTSTVRKAKRRELVLLIKGGRLYCYDRDTGKKVGMTRTRPGDMDRWLGKMNKRRDRKIRRSRHDSEKLYDVE